MNIKKKPIAASLSGMLALSAPAVLAQGMLEEVMVTAQKREQSVSDLGLSVTAFTGDTMRDLGWTQPKDLAAQTPGLIINNTMGDSQPAVMIRGVGINDFNTNTNPGVGVYVDEVVKPIPAMLGFSLFDMERVEVLKGPQGTLYGQNTTGGAVAFHTKAPSDELDGYVSGDVGNYERYSIEAGIGGPITDNIRGRISGITTQQNEGYQEDVFTGDKHGEVDRSAIRAQLAADFGDSVDATLRYTHGEDKSDNQIPRVVEGLDVMQYYYYTFYDGTQNSLDYLDTLKGDNDAFLDNEYDSLGLTVNADLGFATLTSVTGYDEMTHRNVTPFPGTELPVQNADYGGDLESLSQEFRLSSNEGELVDWILGLYYGKVEQDNVSDLEMTAGFGYLFYLYELTALPEFTQVKTAYNQELTTTAVFAHTEWHLGDTLKLTAGARYAQDELEYDVRTSSYRTPACSGVLCDIADLYYGLTDYDSAFSTFLNLSDFGQFDGVRQGGTIGEKQDSVDENHFTWRLGLDWMPNDDYLFYANVATGTKAHGFYGGLATTSVAYSAYDPEEIMSYEVGFKLALLDRTMQLDGAVFHYQYEDQQVIASTDPGIGIPNDILTNLGESEITGAELDLTWAPVDGLTTRFTASWLDTELTDTSISTPLPSFPGTELSEGSELAYAPELTLSGLVRYDFSLTSNLGAFVQVDGDYSDEQLALPGREDTMLESRTLWNARLGLTSATGSWEASVWGRNLGDEEYATYRYVAVPGTYNEHFGMPRTYGLTLRYNFGAAY